MYTHYNGTYNNVCTQVHTTVYGCGRGLRGPVGVGWCARDKTNTRTRPPCWGLHGVRTLCTVLRTLSDLGGGHNVNLRDKCGVCDG